MVRLLRPRDVYPAERLVQDLSVQEQECTQRLFLGGGRYIRLYSQISQKRLYFYVAHLFGVALAMEENVLLDPEKIRFLRAL